jgi:hypothetical protein
MRSGRHITPHDFLAIPRRHRPEGERAIWKKRSLAKTRGAPDLANGLSRMQKKSGHEEQRSNS